MEPLASNSNSFPQNSFASDAVHGGHGDLLSRSRIASAATSILQPASIHSRRHFLRIAAGVSLSLALPALEGRAVEARGNERPKSFILVWLGGGPSQLESWDPHPGTGIGGETKSIKTAMPGVEISNFYPKMADELASLCLIRSMVSKEGDHERGSYLLKTGYRPEQAVVHPSLGAIITHELPAAGVEIPRHLSIVSSQWPARGGFLGNEYDAFQLPDPSASLTNVKALAEGERQTKRLDSLAMVEKAFRKGRRNSVAATLHEETVRRALTMMSSEQLKAFDVDLEPAEVRAAYGNSAFGRGCLIARRMVEAGVRSIEVNLEGFDTHANNFEGQKVQAGILDPALAALVKDLRERDLLDSTVLLCIGEFGRTPNINPFGGRDHWPTGFSALVGGGGFQKGLLIGETDPEGKETTPKDPIEVQDLYATILKTLGVNHRREVTTPIGRPIRLSEGSPLDRLLQNPVA